MSTKVITPKSAVAWVISIRTRIVLIGVFITWSSRGDSLPKLSGTEVEKWIRSLSTLTAMHEFSTIRWMKLNMKLMWLVRQGWSTTEIVTHCSRNRDGRKEAISFHEVLPLVGSGPSQEPGSARTSCRGLKICQAPTSSSNASFVRELNAIRYHWTLTERTDNLSTTKSECRRKAVRECD